MGIRNPMHFAAQEYDPGESNARLLAELDTSHELLHRTNQQEHVS
jgi:hypothetical protein